MNDLISRRAAIDALGDEPEVWSGKDEYDQGLNNQWHYDRTAILAVPSAEPERKTGRWTIEDCHSATYKYCCSECGAHHRAMYDFCPHCGADMRGKQDD